MLRRTLVGALALWLVATAALSATWLDSTSTNIAGAVMHWISGGVSVPVSSANPFPVTVAPYAYTPLTPGQHNLAITTATALTVPTGSTYATVCESTANAKYTTDGTTTPTLTVGMTLAAGACVTLSGGTVIANFRAISATGTLDIEFYR